MKLMNAITGFFRGFRHGYSSGKAARVAREVENQSPGMNTIGGETTPVELKVADIQKEIDKLLSNFEAQHEKKAQIRGYEDLLEEFGRLKESLPVLYAGWDGKHDSQEILELSQSISNKLSMSDGVITGDEFWWESAKHTEIETLLRKIQKALREAAKRRRWRRALPYIWSLMVELIYLVIVIALVSSTQSSFEKRVTAMLVLIYNAVRYFQLSTALGDSVHWTGLAFDISRLGRGLKQRWNAVDESDELVKERVKILIQMGGFSVGTLIAIVNLLMTV